MRPQNWYHDDVLDDRSYMRTDARPRWSVTTVLLITLVVCYVAQIILERKRLSLRQQLRAEPRRPEARKNLATDYVPVHARERHAPVDERARRFLFWTCDRRSDRRSGIAQALSAQRHFRWVITSRLWNRSFTDSFPESVVGASAGVFGLIAAFATRAPDMPITLLLFFFLPVTFPAKVLLMIEALIAIFGLLPIGFMPGVAHGAHLGGMLTGIGFIKWMNRPRRTMVVWKPERRKPQLVSNAPKRAAWRKPRKKAEEVPTGEFISREFDPILEKISAHGIHSLTDQELKILEAARDKMAKR